MGFSNKKEDVIYMELTPYGRHLLSIGKLKPEYYAFFDDDILYDIGTVYDGSTYLTESNGATKERILNETPYLKPFVSFTNRDKNIVSRQNIYLYEDLSDNEDKEKVSFMSYPIGTSNYHSGQLTPYWSVVYLHGTASSTETSPNVWTSNTSKNLQSSHGLPNQNIPQIDFSIDYEISIKNINTQDNDLDQLDLSSPNLPITEISANGNYVSLKEKQLMLHITEENAFSYTDSFSVEVYEYDDLEPNTLKPLRFRSDPSIVSIGDVEQRIVNGILKEIPKPPDSDVTGGLDVEDPTLVEYFFDFRVDKEIPEEDICNGAVQLSTKEIFVDLDVECIERAGLEANIYTSQADPEEC